MNKFEKSKILMLFLLAILLIILPMVSSSLRAPYFYIITNLLIIALGAQSSLLSASSKPSDREKKNSTVSAAHKPVIASELACSDKRVLAHNDEDQRVASESVEKNPKVIEKSMSEKIVLTVKMKILKKCLPMPSLFFIADGEADQVDHEATEDNHELEEEEVEELSGQELYANAETLIGDFYKQLKIQREESWKRIHGFYP